MPKKPEIVTFKADASLLEAMQGISNRSEFIRSAVLAALENACPLCKGSGILTPNQKKHWEIFAASHALEVCSDCQELNLVCARQKQVPAHSEGEGTNGQKS